MIELRYVGVDEEKEDLVVFELNREKAVNAFLWVMPNEGERLLLNVFPCHRFISYADHSGSPFWVREDGAEGLIEKALKVIEDYPKDKLMEKLEEFDEEYNGEDRDDKWFEGWDKDEKAIYDEIEEARKGSGYWPWNPDEEQ